MIKIFVQSLFKSLYAQVSFCGDLITQGKSEAVCRAVMGKLDKPVVFDATAGLGREYDPAVSRMLCNHV